MLDQNGTASEALKREDGWDKRRCNALVIMAMTAFGYFVPFYDDSSSSYSKHRLQSPRTYIPAARPLAYRSGESQHVALPWPANHSIAHSAKLSSCKADKLYASGPRM